MNDTQILTIVLATAPTMLTVLIGILINNARLSDLRSHMDARFNGTDTRFGDVDARFRSMEARFGGTEARFAELRAHMDARFDDMRDTWRSDLRRVEEVIDARLRHLEER